MPLGLIKFPAAKGRRRRPPRLDPDLQLLDNLRRDHPMAFAMVIRLAEECLALQRRRRSDDDAG